jgi:hypothetical protein
LAEKVSEEGVVYGRISSWFRNFEEKGLAPEWVVERVLFKVSTAEPIKIGKFTFSRKPVYTLLGNYEFVRTFHIRVPFTRI